MKRKHKRKCRFVVYLASCKIFLTSEKLLTSNPAINAISLRCCIKNSQIRLIFGCSSTVTGAESRVWSRPSSLTRLWAGRESVQLHINLHILCAASAVLCILLISISIFKVNIEFINHSMQPWSS